MLVDRNCGMHKRESLRIVLQSSKAIHLAVQSQSLAPDHCHLELKFASGNLLNVTFQHERVVRIFTHLDRRVLLA